MTQLGPGGSVVLDVVVPERVELVFLRSGDGAQSSVSVCTLDGRELQCSPEYENRASLTCSLTLTATNQSVYVLRDLDNDEIISTHTLTLSHTGTHSHNCTLSRALFLVNDVKVCVCVHFTNTSAFNITGNDTLVNNTTPAKGTQL